MKEDTYKAKHSVLVCCGEDCKKAGAKKLSGVLEEAMNERGVPGRVLRTSCMGRCGKAPVVVVYPEGQCFTELGLKDTDAIAKAIVKGAKKDKAKRKEKKEKKEKGKEKKRHAEADSAAESVCTVEEFETAVAAIETAGAPGAGEAEGGC
jgi:(2Fe-2S) ferredoxin